MTSEPTVEEIRERGHWLVTIRPAKHTSSRVPFEDLEPILNRVRVSLRGWDFPHISSRTPILYGTYHIAQSSRYQHHVEHWRFYDSGQFLHLAGFGEDWRDQSSLYPPPDPSWKPGASLGISDTLFRYTEVLELASRLAVTPAGESQMNVVVTANGLRDRHLFVDDPARAPLHADYSASGADFTDNRVIERTALVGEAWEIAIDYAYQLFLRFGWKADRDTLREAQSQLARSR